jgi:hypothetical protein
MRPLGWILGACFLAAGVAWARAELATPRELPPSDYVPAGEPPQHADMDHAEKNHHHHLHKVDHKGSEHSPAGLHDHHHHHHNHPHAADPHHHHPH